MSAVMPANQSVAFIRRKIRRLTASSGGSTLTTDSIDEYINNFYQSDFPYAIKMDQMRSVYTFFTEPYRDRYPLDVNNNMGVRGPAYIEGIRASLYKERDQFFNIWPRFPTKFQPISGDGVTTSFTFNIPGPFLSKEVVLGGVDSGGSPISVNDDGNGNLQLQVPNPVVTVPPYTDVYPNDYVVVALRGKAISGMHNQNTLNPGLNRTNTTTTGFVLSIGSVNYVTGDCAINFPVAPASGTQMTMWVSQYQTGRPYSILYWNNELTIRPVPKEIHKCEIETYLTPVQFMLTSDTPILNQWAQYLAYGAACEILRDRQDFDGLQNLQEGFQRQEALVLERQGVEEIGTPTTTFFNGTNQNWNNTFWGLGGW